jgi:hypothetical protein
MELLGIFAKRRSSGSYAEIVAEENKRLFKANSPRSIPRNKNSSARNIEHQILGN